MFGLSFVSGSPDSWSIDGVAGCLCCNRKRKALEDELVDIEPRPRGAKLACIERLALVSWT